MRLWHWGCRDCTTAGAANREESALTDAWKHAYAYDHEIVQPYAEEIPVGDTATAGPLPPRIVEPRSVREEIADALEAEPVPEFDFDPPPMEPYGDEGD